MSTAGLLRANLHRRPVRTWLTLLSLLVAFLLFSILRTFAGIFTQGAGGVDAASRLVVTARYSIIESLPISQQARILAVDGVNAVTHMTWFGGIYQDPRNFFPKHPVEPRAYFDMYPEFSIDPAELDAFANTRTGAVVARTLMERFGWRIGDRIPIEADIWPMADGSRNWEFELVGAFASREGGAEPPVMLFRYDYFDEARMYGQGTAGWYVARIDDPARAPEIAGAIDALFENSRNPVKSATEDAFARSFAAQIGDIELITTGILSAVFFTILLLTANTMSQSLRERIAELAVLKTLGFSNVRVALLVLGEAMLLCVAGGLLGIGLAALAAPLLSAFFEQNGFGTFRVAWDVAALAIGIALALGAAVGAAPAWTANRLAIAEALRRS